MVLSVVNIGMERKICPICKKHPVAVNYHKRGRTYFRSACTPCIHKGRQIQPEVPGWVKSGYKKRDRCDRCSFRFKLTEQSNVYYTDGNTSNNNWANLKTVCLNCQTEIAGTNWRPAAIQPDF